MPITSYSFLFFFLPISIVFHSFAARFGERFRLTALIAVSFAFCMAWDIRAAALMGASIVVNYIIGRLIQHTRDDENALNCNAALAAGIVFNLGILFAFRYADFLLGNVDAVSGANFSIARILVPLGVLFYSCDQIAYLADIRRGKNYRPGFLRFAAFASFFPRLLAGPLVRYEQIEPQWNTNGPNSEDFAVGLTTFIIGLAKTVLLAGSVAPIAATVFSAAQDGQQIEFFAAWTGVLAFTCQIYFDLSGYADMAIGIGRCFGIKLPVNFRSPYRAANIAEFWRRWNITLASFLRDYIYLPLGGDRRGTVRAAINLVITMVLGGLWYGAGNMFLAWALLHSFYLLLYRAWRAFAARYDFVAQFRLTTAAYVLSVAFTFLAVMLSWIVFRAPDSATGLELFAAISGQYGAILPHGFSMPLLESLGISFAAADSGALLQAWGAILLCLAVIFALPNTESLFSGHHSIISDDGVETQKLLPVRWMPSVLWSVVLGAMAFACLVSPNGANIFLHWRF